MKYSIIVFSSANGHYLEKVEGEQLTINGITCILRKNTIGSGWQIDDYDSGYKICAAIGLDACKEIAKELLTKREYASRIKKVKLRFKELNIEFPLNK